MPKWLWKPKRIRKPSLILSASVFSFLVWPAYLKGESLAFGVSDMEGENSSLLLKFKKTCGDSSLWVTFGACG
jgi:hypothetical protein